jgi:hypothetical protein
MLKPKNSQSSGYTLITKQAEKLCTNVVCQKADDLFLEQERSADGGVHETRGHNNIISVLRNTKKLRRAIQNRRGMLAYSVLVVLLHDNECQHTAARTRALLEHLNWVLFDRPPYSPDLAPSDYHLFTYLKN